MMDCTLDTLLRQVSTTAAAYLRGLPERKVRASDTAIARLLELGGSFPEEPLAPAEVLRVLDEIGSAATVATAGSRYFGFVTGGTLPAALAAGWLVSTWDQNAAQRVMSPVGAELESVALRWIATALGLPSTTGGALVTGATMANFTAICAARHELLARLGWDVENDGLFGAPEIRVVAGDEVHVSALKALSMAGLGKQRLHRVPVDAQGRMRAELLPKLDARTLVLIQAGNVNSGAFDPAAEICRQAQEAGAWVHVDGAFGLWAAASPKYRHLMEGFERADSWATDGHKWPNAGYDCGIVLVRDPEQLRAAMAVSAAYLAPGRLREPSDFSPELSRRARGIEFWAVLRSLGRQGLATLIERTCEHAQRFAAGLREAGFEVLNDVVVNQVMVSFGTPERTREVIARIQREGTMWAGATQWQGRTAMRISVSSWATTTEDVDLSLAAIRRVAQQP